MLAALGQVLIYIVPFLLVLTFIVTIHELGHFLVARAFGVKVDRFAVGFGKAVFSRTDRHGIEWRLGWLPLGGYVKFSGDLDASSVPDQAGLNELRQRVVAERGPGAERDYFHFKPVWQRALVVAAGPIANFILAIALFSGAWFTYGTDQLGQGKENSRQFLKDNPELADEIEDKILAALGIGEPGRKAREEAEAAEAEAAAKASKAASDDAATSAVKAAKGRKKTSDEEIDAAFGEEAGGF